MPNGPIDLRLDINLNTTSRKWLTVAIWLSWMTVIDDFHG